MKISKDYSLLPHNTFGMDVKASLFIEYASVEELKEVLNKYPLKENKWLHVGGGSNLLFIGNYEGMILHSGIKGYEMVSENADEVIVRVGAGEIWDDFVAYTVGKGWYGAENLSLIPGEVGASLQINGTTIPSASVYIPTTADDSQIVIQYNLTTTTGTDTISIVNASTVPNNYSDSNLSIIKLA